MAEELSCTGLKVLVAEDTPVGQKLMKALLQAFGCVADVAANGREAVEKVRENDYDVVLMDIMMPVMGGLDATRAIRAGGNDTLPIIALTAAVMKEDGERSRAAGLDLFQKKYTMSHKILRKFAEWGHASHGSPSPKGAEK